jgi:hypothetical protein
LQTATTPTRVEDFVWPLLLLSASLLAQLRHRTKGARDWFGSGPFHPHHAHLLLDPAARRQPEPAGGRCAATQSPQRGGSRPGERRGGRKKGTPNKLTANVKAAITAAFADAGGKDYLVMVAKTDPRTFCTLLGKVLPTQIGSDTDQPVRIEFSWLAPSGS